MPARLAVAVKRPEGVGSVGYRVQRQPDSSIGAGQEVQEGLFDCNGLMCEGAHCLRRREYAFIAR